MEVWRGWREEWEEEGWERRLEEGLERARKKMGFYSTKPKHKNRRGLERDWRRGMGVVGEERGGKPDLETITK